MKIILLLNKDIHSVTAFRLLGNCLEDHQVKVLFSEKVGNLDGVCEGVLEMKRIENDGFDEFYRELILVNNFDADFVKNINSQESLEEIKNFAPDLIISIRFGQILKDEVIGLSRLGVINLHSGILPKYRGIMATFWAILNGEKEIGTTLHYIEDAQIDMGEIIKISKQKINFDKTLFENINSLYFNGCLDIANFLGEIENGKKYKITNKRVLEDGNYYSYPHKKDLIKFHDIMRLF
jgi:methionyl-tRNA formyltransferase